jgi:hypothetical protein
VVHEGKVAFSAALGGRRAPSTAAVASCQAAVFSCSSPTCCQRMVPSLPTR